MTLRAGLAEHLSALPSAAAFDPWIAQLSSWGAPIQAAAAASAAVSTRPHWTLYSAPDAHEWHTPSTSVDRAFAGLDAWLTGGSSAPLRDVLAALCSDVARMAGYVEEASGSAAECSRRETALSAARAALHACEAILWTPASIPSFWDDAERLAREAAGPLDETVAACRAAAFAHGSTDRVARAIGAHLGRRTP
ncbi:MAG: hypothetical protein U0414_42075 [Polyangiaceae bacterium]